MDSTLAQLCVNTIRLLAADGVEKAQSGHPGMPMGAADCAFVLWSHAMRFSPKNPTWPNRDRFVLSAGHGSMLLYSLLHLFGFDLSMDDLRNFRQWGSRTPGHPEFGMTPGVEATTGPLGQGVGMGVGMAIAAKMMAERMNQPDFSPIDHYIYGIAGDGDLMEGVASEAASMAGHLRLNNLIYIYDDNHISIDGRTELTFTEDVAKRFDAYGWFTKRIDGHNHTQIVEAIATAKAQKEKPSLILARTHIGRGAPTKQDTAEVHGAPLGKEELRATKAAIGWPDEPAFHLPEVVRNAFLARSAELENEYGRWSLGFANWRKKHPDLAKEWDRLWNREAPANIFDQLRQSLPGMPEATRSISSTLMQTVAKLCPSLIGGSADLNSSTKTIIKNSAAIDAGHFGGRNFNFGVREHGMGAIMNGLALYGSWIPYGSTFLVFSDYMRPAIRLAALSHLPVIFIFTHDTILLGEDGPTHQPVEQLPSLRLIPNHFVIRPADALECGGAWALALQRKHGPTSLILTRQKIPAIERDPNFQPADVLKGAYIVREAKRGKPELVLMASGSELHLAIGAQTNLEANGVPTRVVSVPCVEAFAKQEASYRDSVLPTDARRVVIEAAQGDLWYRWIGSDGLVIGVNRFGASAPEAVLAEKFGFTISQVTKTIENWWK